MEIQYTYSAELIEDGEPCVDIVGMGDSRDEAIARLRGVFAADEIAHGSTAYYANRLIDAALAGKCGRYEIRVTAWEA